MSPFVVRWLKFSLVAIVGCGFMAMAIYAFVKRDEIRNAQVEPPLVSSPLEAVKRRPEQPGGMDLPNRDKMVFDLLDNSGQAGAIDVSGSLVQPSAGAAPTVSEVIATAKALPAAKAVSEVAVSTSALEALPQAKPVVASAKVVEASPVVVQAPAPVVAVATKTEVKPETKAAEALVVKADEKKESTVAKAVTSWGVQLGAVGSKADADKAVANLAKNAAVKGLKPNVVAAPDGKHFRIQFIGLKDRAAAAAVCSKLGAKQPCFPVAPK